MENTRDAVEVLDILRREARALEQDTEAGKGSAVDRLEQAQRIAQLAQEIVRDLVEDARWNRHSWSEIGGALGMSKQAAQQRFGTSTTV